MSRTVRGRFCDPPKTCRTIRGRFCDPPKTCRTIRGSFCDPAKTCRTPRGRLAGTPANVPHVGVGLRELPQMRRTLELACGNSRKCAARWNRLAGTPANAPHVRVGLRELPQMRRTVARSLRELPQTPRMLELACGNSRKCAARWSELAGTPASKYFLSFFKSCGRTSWFPPSAHEG